MNPECSDRSYCAAGVPPAGDWDGCVAAVNDFPLRYVKAVSRINATMATRTNPRVYCGGRKMKVEKMAMTTPHAT